MYSGSKNGWSTSTFHSMCDNKGPTLTIFKSSAAKIFGGFTMISWTCLQGFKQDDKAFIFSADNLKIYNIIKPDEAIYHYGGYGPSFGNSSLEINSQTMNTKLGARSFTDSQAAQRYNTKLEANGNHEITGEGSNQSGDNRKWTCVELEVYALKFE